MHKLLRRQLAKAGGATAPPSGAEWEDLLACVDEAYERADKDRLLLERSLELTSNELLARNAALRADIATRRASEKEALVTASLLAATLDSTGDGILVVDLRGQITAWNRRFAQMWRIDPDVLARRDDRAVLAHVLDQLADPDGFLATVASLYADTLAEAHDLVAFQDGRVFERSARPQMLDRQPVGRVWCFRDVTESHRVEDALRKSEARARSLVENISDVITIADEEGAYRYVSPSVTRILGYEPSEFLGRKILEFVHPDDAATIAASLDRLGRTSEATRTEFRYRHKDGSWRTLESLRVDARGKPGIEGFLGVARDVTEQRRLETEARSRQESTWRQERLSALGTLVAGVAHEVNNPLTYIIGNLEMAQFALDEMPPSAQVDEVRRQIDTAIAGSQRIARITSSLKTVSRQQTAAGHTKVDMRRLVADAADLVRIGTPGHVELLVEEDPEEVAVVGDPSQLHQVVLNLAKNAAEALGSRPGKVRIGVRRAAPNAEIHVMDDGPGIDAAVQARLFTPFFTTKGEGTGLGLSIVHSIVKSHGGEVHVDSTPGRGTTFVVRIPLASAS